MSAPKKIKLNKQESLIITWQDGKKHEFPLRLLRDESPDAGNKGETILWKHYPPAPKGPDKPGKYEVADITKTGSYAIQIKWKDGNDHGIYSWKFLQALAEHPDVKETEE